MDKNKIETGKYIAKLESEIKYLRNLLDDQEIYYKEYYKED